MNLHNQTRRLMEKYKIRADKNLGQNFLINQDALQSIVTLSDVNSQDLVIEIGPGLGTLTKELLDVSGKVIAIELDKRMTEILVDRFNSYENFKFVNNDILKIDLQKLIDEEKGNLKQVKVIANLPYYITTDIIMKLLEQRLNINMITVMVQKEVANRLTVGAGNKEAGSITYAIDYYSESSLIINVDKTSFIPIPKVDSSVIQLKIRKTPPVEVKNETLMFKLIKAAFMQRRKTLLNSVENSNLLTKEQLKQILKKLNIDENIRGEKLTLQDFANIANNINKND